MHAITIQSCAVDLLHWLLLHLQDATDAAAKQLDELREQLETAKQAAADETAKTAAAHMVELQKLQVEQNKLEVSRLLFASLPKLHIGWLCFSAATS